MTVSPPVRFPAKLLLFGEYSILLGSTALSVPCNLFSASLDFTTNIKGDLLPDALESNRHLMRMVYYFIKNPGDLERFVDLESLGHDIRNGLYLSSTIPRRYGLGSSGALCAAVYHRYRFRRQGMAGQEEMTDLPLLRNIFIEMESCFHGRSSGFDPLVSYLRVPLLLNEQGKVTLAETGNCRMPRNGIGVLLVDTGQPCETGPLVGTFLGEFSPGGITTDAGTHYCSLVNAATEGYLGNIPGRFWEAVDSLSSFQLTYLNRLIPETLRTVWQYGLQTGSFTLKLCGSGGGGYLLCFTHDQDKATGYLRDRNFPVTGITW